MRHLVGSADERSWTGGSAAARGTGRAIKLPTSLSRWGRVRLQKRNVANQSNPVRISFCRIGVFIIQGLNIYQIGSDAFPCHTNPDERISMVALADHHILQNSPQVPDGVVTRLDARFQREIDVEQVWPSN